MRKNVKNAILTLLILALSVSTAFLIYLHFFSAADRNPAGEWTAELDMTEQAAVMAFSWLQEIEAVSISPEDVEASMQNLTVQVDLTLERMFRLEGSFRCSVLPESYEACRQAAYEAFAGVFQEALAERLRRAGYTGDTDREAVEALVVETFGMSTVSYLMTCGPALLPSLGELQAQYDGSGIYEAAEGILTRQFDGAAKAERYIWQDANLILLEDMGSVKSGSQFDYYPIVYTLRQLE